MTYHQQQSSELWKKNAAKEVEYLLKRKDGSAFSCILNATVVKNQITNATEVRIAAFDITAHKRLENELNSLYNTAPCGYYSVDENRLVTRMNDTLLNWLGYTRDEVVGKVQTLAFIVRSDDDYQEQQQIKFKQNSVLKEVESMMKRKDGSLFPAVFNVVAVKDAAGNVTEVRVVAFDITAHKRLENELKATSEQLFEANEDKNKFIGIASHDLQNPITAILMSAELLQKATPHPTPMQQKLFGNIKSSADRMSYLVSNILTINRIERGMVSDDWRTVNLKSIVWDIASRNQIFANRKNIQIHQFADDATNWNILTEPNYLTQAIENLLSNAIKFSHKNKNIMLDLVRRDDEMDIVIADEGQGIKEQDMHRLFGRFQKLSARPTGNEVSTGLGLSVTKEFVDVLKGRISVKSTWGIGTTFTVTLPIKPVFEEK